MSFSISSSQLCSHTPSALNAGAKRSGATCHMAMPQCCYLAKGAKRPSHTTNMKHFFGLVQPKFIFGLLQPKFIFGLVQPKFIFGLVNSRLPKVCILHFCSGFRWTAVLESVQRNPLTNAVTLQSIPLYWQFFCSEFCCKALDSTIKYLKHSDLAVDSTKHCRR